MEQRIMVAEVNEIVKLLDNMRIKTRSYLDNA